MTVFIYDIEVYRNCFVAVFLNHHTGDEHTFSIYDTIDQRQELITFMKQNAWFVGYNNIKYDGVILQHIISRPDIPLDELKELSDNLINGTASFPNDGIGFKQIDLLKLWHFDNNARATSLKWLEFFLRERYIKDLPYDHKSTIRSATAHEKIVKYCRMDVDVTNKFYKLSRKKLMNRIQVSKEFGFDAMNMSDATAGEQIIISSYEKFTGKEIPRNGTDRKQIVLSELPLQQYRDRGGITSKVLREHFDNIVLKGKRGKRGLHEFVFKGYNKEYHWQGLEFVVGMGGIHGCVDKGVYESDDDCVIMSDDVTSQYPNMVIANDIYPEHIGQDFVSVYDEHIYQKRRLYPKKTHFSQNMTYKLALNAAIGKFKSVFSQLYDPKCNLQVTVNCQMAILALAEDLCTIPGTRLLMLNTDGLEIMVPRKHLELWSQLRENWMNKTSFALENVEYQKLVVYDVNNYIAVTSNGYVKRKGQFCTYEDLVNHEEYHKNPKARIIPLALNNYFTSGIPIEDTVNNCDDIHEFLYGVKKTRSFNYALIVPSDDRTVKIDVYKERVFRYYVSTSPKSGNLVKIWFDGRITSVNKGELIMPALSLRTEKASKFTDLDREYYINAAHKIRSEIEFSKVKSPGAAGTQTAQT